MNIDNLDLDAGGVLIHGGPHLNVARTILTALRDDLVPGRAIAVGLAIDDEKEARQLLAISQRGAAAFTGEMLDPVSVQRVGDNYVAAGQRLPTADIIDAMADAFENSGGPLRDRLLGALHAGRQASEEGGLHSAALLVISPRARFATRHRLVDLRVDFVDGDAVAALEILRFKIDSIYEIN